MYLSLQLRKMKVHRKNSSSLIDKLIKWAGFVLLIALTSLPTIQTTPICYGKVDIVFVIDASYSITQQDFVKVREFVTNLYTKIWNDTKPELRAGVIFYATSMYQGDKMIGLNDDQSQILPTVGPFERDTGNIKTSTGAALGKAYEMFNTHARNDAVKIMVLITDGEADDQTLAYENARRIKQLGVHTLAIGIGADGEKIDRAELNAIASSVDSVYIFTEFTDDLKTMIEKDICGKTQGSKEPPKVPKDDVKMDIYFLVDENILDQDLDILKRFMKEILQSFVIGQGKALASVFLYGRSTGQSFNVGTYTTETALFNAINGLSLNSANSGGRNVVGIFTTLQTRITSSITTGPVIVVLFVTGSVDSSPQAIQLAKTFREASSPKIHLVVIGIGTNTQALNSEQNRLAFDVGTAFQAQNSLTLTGEDQASIDLIASIRKVIYQLAKGTYVTTGTGISYRWPSMVDVVFMIDGSSKMSQYANALVVKFVIKELVDEFELGPEKGRVALLVFDAAGVYNSIRFDTYNHDHDTLNTKIDNLQLIQRADTADNTLALKAMRQYFLDNNRESATKLGYLITLGQARNKLLAEAEARALAFQGIQLLVIGIGSGVSEDELNSYQMFDPVDGPVLIAPIGRLASTQNLRELKDDLFSYAMISRTRGRYFQWEAKFDLIVLVLDESGRLDGGARVRYFLQDLFHRYQIGVNQVLGGVITFGANVNTGAGKEIILGSDKFFTALLVNILKLDLTPTGGTNVLAALNALIAMFKTHGRPNVPKVALLLFEGDVVLDELKAKIQEVRDTEKIAMAAVGIGPGTDMVDLRNMAYNKEAELAFLQTSWQMLSFTPEMDAALIALARGNFQAQGIGDILKLPTQCSGVKAGILFMLDASDVFTSSFDDVKDFTASLMSGFTMPAVDIGALAFATIPLPGFIPLGKYQTYVELYAHFMDNININPFYKLKVTSLAIKKAEELFGAGSYQEKVAVLITDGVSVDTDDIEQATRDARDAGIKLIAIGIDSTSADALDELKLITGDLSTGGVSHIFLKEAKDLTDPRKLESVHNLICALIRPGECLAGSFRDPGTLACSPCPVGSYQTLSEQLFCKKCTLGYITPDFGTSKDNQCIKRCNAGYYLHVQSDACKICLIGEYQPNSGQIQCLDCPAATPVTKFQGSRSVDDCIWDKCAIPMDLVLVIDSTASIGVMNFSMVKAFARNQLNRFDIGSSVDETRVSVVRIGTVTTTTDVTDFLTDENSVVDVIRFLKGGDLSTNIASAIEMASNKLETDGRANIAKVIFIMTDGKSQNPYATRYQALLAQQKYQIVVLGIGSQYFMPELKSLASVPENILTEKNFFKLPALDAYTTICTAASRWTAPTVTVAPSFKCDLALDLILIMDMSSSIADLPLELIMMKLRLTEFIDLLKISTNQVNVGVISFGVTVNTGLQLSAVKQAIKDAIMNPPLAGAGTFTDKALNVAKTMLESSKRADAAKALLIVTDGKSNNPTATAAAAKQVEESGIYAVAVGKGDSNSLDFKKELNAISTTGSDTTIFVTSLMDLTGNMLAEKVCPEHFRCTYNLQVIYIWYLSGSVAVLDKTTKFSADVSERFADVQARVIEVKDNTEIDTLLKAMTKADEETEQDQLFDTIHNVVLITDKPSTDIGNDVTALKTKTTTLKEHGVKITIVSAQDTRDTDWEQYATSSETVFYGKKFDDSVPAWKFHRSLCKEPCDSGYEIGTDGRCKQCDVGKYRDKTKSYLCKTCSSDSTTAASGSTSVAQCTIRIKCEKPMDLIFVIDATASIGNNYNLLKLFFWTLVDKFPVGLRDDETRIAAVKIGEDLKEEDYSLLSQSDSHISVKANIIGLQGNEQATNTAASIAKVYEIFKSEGRDQKKYPHIVLVATDGRSSNTFQTKRYASILKLNAIHTLVISLGSGVIQSEIDALAYDANSVFRFDTYRALIESTYIHERICDAAKNYKPLLPETGGPALLGECKSYMDIVFVIDASLSVSQLTFLKMRIFIAQFAQRLDLGEDKIRIGIIAFSSTVHSEVFSLEQCTDQRTLEVDGIQPQIWDSTGTTNTAAGLDRMINMFTTKGRKNSPYIGIVVTDGRSDNPANTKIQAQRAKETGIHMVAIGFGQNFGTSSELYDIATDPASVKVVDSFDELTTKQLLDLSCSFNFECPHKMDIIAIWDLENFDTIRRAEIYIESLKESFLNSKVTDIYVDHVDDAALAMEEALQRMQYTTKTDFDAARVIMVITDKTLDANVKARLQTVATNANNAGILRAVVDAAAVPNNLANIASNNKLIYVTTKFDMLPYRLVLKRSMCTVPCPSGSQVSASSAVGGSCEPCPVNKYRVADESFLCIDCPPGRTTDGATGADQLSDCLFGDCSAPMDVVFVVDSSSSIRTMEYILMKVFLTNTIKRMDISADRTRVGIVPYSSDIFSSQLFELQESTRQEAVLEAVGKMNQGELPTGTNTAGAIYVAKNMLLTQGRRTGGVTQIMVVITDGMSTNTYRTAEEAKKAKDLFIRSYVLGVGPNVFIAELDKIASDEDSKMLVNSFLKLAAITDFTKTICEDSFTCGKMMDVVIFEDRTTGDAAFKARFDSFQTKITSSSSTVNSFSYQNMNDLDTLVKIQDLSTNPQKTKVFLFITRTDIADDTAKSSIASNLRSKGGIVTVINANDNLENTNFVTMVSSLQFLFNVENFDELPSYRFIERKLCIDPCLDGEQRGLDGECEKCPRGKYRVKTVSHTCEECSGDKTTVNTGTVQSTGCIPNCGPGYKTVGDNCVECAKGEYQADSFQSDCDTCSAGYTTVETKSTSIDQCIKNCDAGKKVSETDKDTCEECEKNTYQPEKAQTQCIDCPINLITSAAGSVSLQDCNDACGRAMDIIFLVDASISLSTISFQLIKVFLQNSIIRFKVSQTATRIGIIQFSDVAAVSPRLDLTGSTDRNTAISLARALIHSTRAGTNTAAAIDAAVKMFDDQGRTGIHKNIVVVTDGMSTNTAQTEAAAARAKKKFINIVAIGVGNNFYLDELKKIATDETAVKTFTSFYSLIRFNILPIVCTPTKFSCDKNMDIFYIKHYDSNSGVDAQVTAFLSKLTDRYKTGTTKTLVDNPSTESLTDDLNAFSDTTNPTNTKVLIIFTNKANSEGATATVVKNKGVIVAVVYVSDTQTDKSYDTVVSSQDFLFYVQEFDESPYIDFILRSLCIAPCVDGSERAEAGDCKECEKGTYRKAVSSHTCVDCPSSPRQTTTAGTGATDRSQCVACASNEFPCKTGIAGTTGSRCIDVGLVCDGTSQCNDGSDEICNTCLEGTKWTGTTCEECERGTFQDKTKQTECIKCPEGKTTDGIGKKAETDCNERKTTTTLVCDSSGQQLDYPNGGCVDCEIGYYRNKDLDAVCVQCDDGLTTKQKASTSKDDCVPTCEAGEGLDDKTKQCVDCPVGTYQPEPNKYECLNCPAGTTTQSVKSTQKTDCEDPCPDGKEHPAGSTSNTACRDCPVSTYKSSTDTTCKSCPPGFITLNTGSTTLTDCLPNCDKGTYYDETLKKCERCTFGQYQPDKYKKKCEDCVTGKTTRDQGSDDITDCIVPCPAGFYLPFRLNGQCTPCPQGTYRVDDETVATCTPCESGKNTDDEGSTSIADCKPDCKPGEKIDGSICVPCEVGSYQTLPRQTTCTPCGDYTTTEQTGTESADDCIDTCPSGTELTEKNPVKCQKCAMNTYKESGVDKKCVACPANHITLSDGAVSSTECVPDCTDGQEWDETALQCKACETGTFQPLFYQYFCVKCRDKWITLSVGAKQESNCFPDCTAGQYWDESALSCVNCQKDSYQSDPYQFTCKKCPEGKFTDNTAAIAESQCKDQCQLGQEMRPGGSSPSECIKCQVGTYKDATETTCQPCENGFTTLTDGKTASTDCIPPCDKGQHWDSDVKLCVKCEVGKYQNEKNQYSCKPCIPSGYTTLDAGSTIVAHCVPPCEAGSAWDSGLGRCKPCEKGTYQDQANKETCESCPPRESTLGEGSKSEDDCIETACGASQWRCVNGECIDEDNRCDSIDHCQDGSDESNRICCGAGRFYSYTTSRCEACLAGTYQDMTGETTCIDCPKGMVSEVGSDDRTDCKECREGFEFIAGNSECTECPVDTYREMNMMKCGNCPPNFGTDLRRGATTLTDCKPKCIVGQYYDSGQFQCEPCPVGWYQDQRQQTECKRCATGLTTSETGSTNINQCRDICDPGKTLVYDTNGEPTTDCNPCPVSTYKDDNVCKPCSTGFTTAGTGSTTCLPNCGPGYYYPDVTAPICLKCLKGTFQPNSLQPSCIPCPAGETTPILGATTSLICYDKCSDGFKYDSATDSCEVCPKGTYRQKDVDSECKSCKTGYTTEGPGTATEDNCVPNCVPGQFYNRVRSRCESCPPKTYQSEPHQYVCENCPAGTTVTTSGSDKMSDCKDPCTVAGEQLQPDGSCGKCEIGTAKVPPSTICTICQAGFTTEGTGSTKCVPNCNEGSYWDGTKCSPCAKATYQSKKYQSSCDDCLTGLTTANRGSTNIGQCIDICPNGFELQFDSVCIPCERNYYRTNGQQLQCTPCPQDFITLFEGAESSDECYPPCGLGEEWDAATGACEPCKTGFYQDTMYQKMCKQCDTGKTTLNTGEMSKDRCLGNCGAGTYWSEAMGQCVDCAKGTYQSESYKDVCAQCSPGFTTDFLKSTSIADCLDKCASGYTYDASTDTCKKCGFHKYRDRAKHNVCHDCPPGLITVTDAATSEAECVSRCSAGESWDKDKRICVKCGIGKFQADTSALECIPCSDGWITLTTGATQISDCKPPCLEGEEWDSTGKTCVSCPRGKYQDTKYQENCKTCSAGTYTQSVHSTRASDCKPTTPVCQTGQWRCLSGDACVDASKRCDGPQDCNDNSDELGCSCQPGEFYDTTTSQCKDCEQGTYQDMSRQLSCIQCPVGYTTAGKNTDSKSGCIEICNDGEKFDPADPSPDDCVLCPVGTYREKGVDNPDSCKSCPTPFTTENSGAKDIGYCVPKCDKGEYYKVLPTAGCTECSLGYYQDQEYNRYSCTKCPPGLTTTAMAATNENQCTDVCGLGEELPEDGTVKAECKQCTAGYYKDSTTYPCKKCADGFTSPVAAESSTACYEVCEAGEEFVTGNRGCKPCDRGYFKATPPTNTDRLCTACPAGLSTLYTRTVSSLLCLDLCNDGLELSADKDSCEPCPVGEYRAQGSGKTACERCPTGTTTSTAGSATIAACKGDCTVGQSYDTGTTSCVDCEIGTYQDVPLQETCKQCPAWKTTVATRSTRYEDCIDPCIDGFQSVNDQCVECERGSYRQQNIQPSCWLCRDKFTTLAPGQDTVDKCVPKCDRGTHWDENSDSCVQCEEGTYNRLEYKLQCLPCPPDTPLSTANYLSCQGDCPPGEMWNADRGICNWCGPGTYSLGGHSDCITCPAGTYSYIRGAAFADCRRICSPGLFRPTVTDTCMPCPAPLISNSVTTACTACSAGLVPSTDRGSCVLPGSDWCPAGQQPFRGFGSRCFPCPAGTFRPSGSRDGCQPCLKDYYQPSTGQAECTPCTNPLTTKTTGTISGDDCKHDHCEGGQEPSGSSCVSCPPGKYKPSGTTGNCLLCPKNSYQNVQGETSCKNCPDGEETLGQGSTQATDCKEDWCPGGQQPNPGSGQCEPCGVGKFKPSGEAGPCRECDTLSYQDETGQTSCKPCTPKGFHTMNTGSTKATDCSAEWCDAGKSMVNPESGETNTDKKCKDCGYGKYRSLMDIGCQTCPSGVTYSFTAKSEDECKDDCPKGSYINFKSETCELCEIGQYTDRENQDKCELCGTRLKTLKKGATSADKCQRNWCPGGLKFDESQEKCVPCGFGKYRSFSKEPDCRECPAGQSTLTDTASSFDECVESGVGSCIDGYLYRDGRCRPCPIGSYSAGNSSGCIECPPGFTTRRVGAYDESLCITMSSQCESRFDLIIAVDLSNSLYHDASHHIYRHLKYWLKCFIKRLDIQPYRVRVSILKYARGVKPLIDLADGDSAERICSLIDKGLKPSVHMNVNTASALQRAYDMFREQGRPGVQKHVLLITDDSSDDPAHAAQVADYLKHKQVHITVVGPDRLEAANLASSTFSQFISPDYVRLPRDYDVVRAVCRPRK